MFFKKKKQKEIKGNVAVIKSLEDLNNLLNSIGFQDEEDDDTFHIEVSGDFSHGTGNLSGTRESLLKGVSVLVKMLIRDTDIDEYDIREAVRIGLDNENIKITRN